MNRPGMTLLAGVFAMASVAPEVGAGTIHIHWPADAPQKLAPANERYYEGIVRLYHNHPEPFAHEHPFYVGLMSDDSFMEKIIARWERHPQRFEYWHPCLWRFLDGYLVGDPGPSPQIFSPPPPIFVPPSGSQGIGSNPNQNAGNPNQNTGSPSASVPEPSSRILMALGQLLALAVAAWRRARGDDARGHRTPACSSPAG